MEEGRCRSCGASIVWIYGATRRMICNPEVLTVITDEGLVVRGRESHFSTCPDANKWRRKRTDGKSDRANIEVESHAEGNSHRG